jgi:hypothetical protein
MSARPASSNSCATHPARVPPSSRLVVMPTISTSGQPSSIASAHASSGSPPKSVSRCTRIPASFQAAVWQPRGVQFDAPRAAAPIADERELLLRYLHRQRELVVESAAELSDAQARWTPDGALLPIIGIINHLAHVEWRWIDGRYLRRVFPPREEEFVVADDVTLAGVIDAYGARAERTESVVRDAPGLDEPCLGCEGDGPPAHVLLGLDAPLDLRWAVLHLIEETARHAGHADATRELLDGRTKS